MADGLIAVQLSVQLPEDADEVDAESVARELRRELLETTDVENVDHSAAQGPSSPDAKGLGGLDWGSLIVTLSASGGVLTAVIGAIQAFLGGARARGVTVQIGDDRLELKAASRGEQRQLVEAFLKRHPDQ
jgi:Effector Associated Constant Component 1